MNGVVLFRKLAVGSKFSRCTSHATQLSHKKKQICYIDDPGVAAVHKDTLVMQVDFRRQVREKNCLAALQKQAPPIF